MNYINLWFLKIVYNLLTISYFVSLIVIPIKAKSNVEEGNALPLGVTVYEYQTDDVKITFKLSGHLYNRTLKLVDFKLEYQPSELSKKGRTQNSKYFGIEPVTFDLSDFFVPKTPETIPVDLETFANLEGRIPPTFQHLGDVVIEFNHQNGNKYPPLYFRLPSDNSFSIMETGLDFSTEVTNYYLRSIFTLFTSEPKNETKIRFFELNNSGDYLNYSDRKIKSRQSKTLNDNEFQIKATTKDYQYHDFLFKTNGDKIELVSFGSNSNIFNSPRSFKLNKDKVVINPEDLFKRVSNLNYLNNQIIMDILTNNGNTKKVIFTFDKTSGISFSIDGNNEFMSISMRTSNKLPNWLTNYFSELRNSKLPIDNTNDKTDFEKNFYNKGKEYQLSSKEIKIALELYFKYQNKLSEMNFQLVIDELFAENEQIKSTSNDVIKSFVRKELWQFLMSPKDNGSINNGSINNGSPQCLNIFKK